MPENRPKSRGIRWVLPKRRQSGNEYEHFFLDIRRFVARTDISSSFDAVVSYIRFGNLRIIDHS